MELWRLTILFVFSMLSTNGMGLVGLHIFDDDTNCTSATLDDYKKSPNYDPKISFEDSQKRCVTFLHQASYGVKNFLIIGDGIGIMLFAFVLYNNFKKPKSETSAKRFGAV